MKAGKLKKIFEKCIKGTYFTIFRVIYKTFLPDNQIYSLLTIIVRSHYRKIKYHKVFMNEIGGK